VIEPLGSEARALLDAARQGMSPDAAAIHRVRAKVGIATAGAGAGAALGLPLGIVAVVVVVVAAVGAGVFATRGTTAAVAPRVELASPSEAPQQAAMHEPAAPAISDDDLITMEPPRAATRPHVEPATVTRAALATIPPVPPHPESHGRSGIAEGGAGAGVTGEPERPRAIDLAREVELLDVAMAALRRGDAGGALRAVQRHAAETAGKGQLAEDAAAIEIEALCHLHDPTTSAKLEAFDARFPRSAQRSRLDNQCP
jgi:hypothetical protein